MSDENRLLVGMEAVNGVLMIGFTAAVLFAILGDFMDQAWNARNSYLIPTLFLCGLFAVAAPKLREFRVR